MRDRAVIGRGGTPVVDDLNEHHNAVRTRS
jgi:hypothetical protein